MRSAIVMTHVLSSEGLERLVQAKVIWKYMKVYAIRRIWRRARRWGVRPLNHGLCLVIQI